MKHIDVKPDSYAECNVDSNEKDPKFELGSRVRISKYKKKKFAKGYTPNCSEEAFIISRIKNTVPWTYVISDLNGEEVAGNFFGKELLKTNQEEFRIKKVINKLYVKRKCYDNSFSE